MSLLDDGGFDPFTDQYGVDPTPYRSIAPGWDAQAPISRDAWDRAMLELAIAGMWGQATQGELGGTAPAQMVITGLGRTPDHPKYDPRSGHATTMVGGPTGIDYRTNPDHGVTPDERAAMIAAMSRAGFANIDDDYVPHGHVDMWNAFGGPSTNFHPTSKGGLWKEGDEVVQAALDRHAAGPLYGTLPNADDLGANPPLDYTNLFAEPVREEKSLPPANPLRGGVDEGDLSSFSLADIAGTFGSLGGLGGMGQEEVAQALATPNGFGAPAPSLAPSPVAPVETGAQLAAPSGPGSYAPNQLDIGGPVTTPSFSPGPGTYDFARSNPLDAAGPAPTPSSANISGPGDYGSAMSNPLMAGGPASPTTPTESFGPGTYGSEMSSPLLAGGPAAPAPAPVSAPAPSFAPSAPSASMSGEQHVGGAPSTSMMDFAGMPTGAAPSVDNPILASEPAPAPAPSSPSSMMSGEQHVGGAPSMGMTEFASMPMDAPAAPVAPSGGPGSYMGVNPTQASGPMGPAFDTAAPTPTPNPGAPAPEPATYANELAEVTPSLPSMVIGTEDPGMLGMAGMPMGTPEVPEYVAPEVPTPAPAPEVEQIAPPEPVPAAAAPTVTAAPARAGEVDEKAAVPGPTPAPAAPPVPRAAPPHIPTITIRPPQAQIAPIAAPAAPVGGLGGLGGFAPAPTVTGLSPSANANIQALYNSGQLGPAPAGASYGYSPFGNGVATVYDNAPMHVQIAATGPGLFGSLGGLGGYNGNDPGGGLSDAGMDAVSDAENSGYGGLW